MKLPVGSAWIVKPFITPATHKHYPESITNGTAQVYGLEARTKPATATSPAWVASLSGESPSFLEIPPDTTIITGETHKDRDALLHPHAEWVEVLFPVRCYVNRVHFNSDSERLARIG